MVTNIAGHRDAVVHDETGWLSAPSDLSTALTRVLLDDRLRARLGQGAAAHAATYTWEATAAGTLTVLAAEAARRRTPRT